MDDDLLALILSGQREFTARVHAIGDEQWAVATPDTEWSVADLVAHLIDEHRWAGPLLHGQDLESAGKVVEGSRSLPVGGGVGANLAQEWDEAAIVSAEAFSAPGAFDREVSLSRGATPVGEYAQEMIVDLVVHSWDLAQAIGYQEPLPEALVSYAYARVAAAGDMSGSGFFAPPVDVAHGASGIDKLVAATGRRPR